jgi:hypothetical protein
VVDIEFDELCGCHSKTQCDRDDAARRCTDDQVKVINDADIVILLKLCQHGSREEAFDTSTIERQNVQRAGPCRLVLNHEIPPLTVGQFGAKIRSSGPARFDRQP